MKKTIAIGCDHIVTDEKIYLADRLEQAGYKVLDCGTYSHPYALSHLRQGRGRGCCQRQGRLWRGPVRHRHRHHQRRQQGPRRPLRPGPRHDLCPVCRRELNANIVGFGGKITGEFLMADIMLAFLEEPYEKTPEHDAPLIAKIDACNKADAEAQADPHFFDEFLEKWDRGEYHD